MPFSMHHRFFRCLLGFVGPHVQLLLSPRGSHVSAARLFSFLQIEPPPPPLRPAPALHSAAVHTPPGRHPRAPPLPQKLRSAATYPPHAAMHPALLALALHSRSLAVPSLTATCADARCRQRASPRVQSLLLHAVLHTRAALISDQSCTPLAQASSRCSRNSLSGVFFDSFTVPSLLCKGMT